MEGRKIHIKLHLSVPCLNLSRSFFHVPFFIANLHPSRGSDDSAHMEFTARIVLHSACLCRICGIPRLIHHRRIRRLFALQPMPQRHSRNSNDLAHFTYEERRKLGFGTQKERLGKDSIKPFDSCSLCIATAVDPLCCRSGHLFCKECIYSCLLTQKKNIKRYAIAAQGIVEDAAR